MVEGADPELLCEGTGDCHLVLPAVLAAGLEQNATNRVTPSRNGWHHQGVQTSVQQQLLRRAGHVI